MTKMFTLYDVRGIQDYIFRSSQIKDVIGASAIVEDIILEAFTSSTKDLSREIKWCDNNGPLPYKPSDKDAQILYIGGGNAYVMFKSQDICNTVNERMALYILEHTYSLQLAVASVEVTGNYKYDSTELRRKMDVVKANMNLTKPLAAMPIMDVEVITGYPKKLGSTLSTETTLKQNKRDEVLRNQKRMERVLDSYLTKKGVDSTIAIVHIDGNNMATRIMGLMKDITEYETAINRMRTISYNISTSYSKVFKDMQHFFNSDEIVDEKDNKYYVMKILTAGDDITYICNGKIALASVEYFAKQITQYCMYGNRNNKNDLMKYGFSICGGIAYIHSHFPFHTGYEVAEQCCANAKTRAKKAENKDGDRIGNFVDFHICKNVMASDLDKLRKNEYITPSNEALLKRPLFIYCNDGDKFNELNNAYFSLDKFNKNIHFFMHSENKLPRSFLKDLRNTYASGESEMKILCSFLNSRDWVLPDHTYESFENHIAKWYDELEMLDLYIGLNDIEKETDND